MIFYYALFMTLLCFMAGCANAYWAYQTESDSGSDFTGCAVVILHGFVALILLSMAAIGSLVIAFELLSTQHM